MKKTLVVVLALLMATMVFTLVSCSSGDEGQVKEYVAKMNEQLAPQMDAFKAQGLDMTIEARGTKMVIAVALPDEVLEGIPASEFQGLAAGFESVCPFEVVKNDCPAVTAIVIEVRGTSGRVVHSEEIN